METKIADENEKTLEVNEKDNEWKSCCFKADKDFLKFFVQVAISFMILALSIYKLCIITGNSEDKSSETETCLKVVIMGEDYHMIIEQKMN